jgi:hypothetical protein
VLTYGLEPVGQCTVVKADIFDHYLIHFDTRIVTHISERKHGGVRVRELE